jgi:hypothetical protein
VCPSGVPGITTEPRHFETWERLPEALRQDLVNAIVEEDHNVELDGWPSHKAVRRTAARDRAVVMLARHMRVEELPRWVVPLAQSIADGVRDRCVWCMGQRRSEPQAALPGLWKPVPKAAPEVVARPRADLPPGVLPTAEALNLLREKLKGLRKP